MRCSYLPTTILALAGLMAVASPAIAENGLAADTGSASMESIEARCAADATLQAEFQHCMSRMGNEWQQTQFNTAKPAPKVRPDAPEVNLDWTPQQAAGLTKELHLSLNGE